MRTFFKPTLVFAAVSKKGGDQRGLAGDMGTFWGPKIHRIYNKKEKIYVIPTVPA
jgi:hypothetical protein